MSCSTFASKSQMDKIHQLNPPAVSAHGSGGAYIHFSYSVCNKKMWEWKAVNQRCFHIKDNPTDQNYYQKW